MPLYSIGQFSKICGIPVKTLRYYDEIGLIKPTYIDPESDYRYYDYDKIRIIKEIAKLKECRFSLPEIKVLLETGTKQEWGIHLREKAAELERQIQQIQTAILSLGEVRERIDRGDDLLAEVSLSSCSLEEREAVTVMGVRKTIRLHEIDTLVEQLLERIYAYKLAISGKLMGVFHDNSHEKQDIEVCFPIEQAGSSIPGIREMKGGSFACIVVKGPYSELWSGYARLFGWMKQEGLYQTGTPFEIYEDGLVPEEVDYRKIRAVRDKNPFNFITKICIPVSRDKVI